MGNPTLKPTQRMVIEQDLANAKEQLRNPEMASHIQDKGALHRQVKRMEETLAKQAPKPYDTPMEKDHAMRRAKELSDGFTLNMPSKEEMRRNRDGGVYKHMAWEKQFKPDILEWRELVKRLEPESDDPNLTSYERMRPERPFGYDVTAQIPGYHAMGPAAKQNWPLGEPKAATAVSHLATLGSTGPQEPVAEKQEPALASLTSQDDTAGATDGATHKTEQKKPKGLKPVFLKD